MTHKRAVLDKYVNDKDFNMKAVADALDMSRMGAINAMKNESVEVLEELKWTVENSKTDTP